MENRNVQPLKMLLLGVFLRQVHERFWMLFIFSIIHNMCLFCQLRSAHMNTKPKPKPKPKKKADKARGVNENPYGNFNILAFSILLFVCFKFGHKAVYINMIFIVFRLNLQQLGFGSLKTIINRICGIIEKRRVLVCNNI